MGYSDLRVFHVHDRIVVVPYGLLRILLPYAVHAILYRYRPPSNVESRMFVTGYTYRLAVIKNLYRIIIRHHRYVYMYIIVNVLLFQSTDILI